MPGTTGKGKRISRLTLGTAQLGLDYGVANQSGKPGRAESRAILRAALDGGVNSFDTAPAYGDSERILGAFLADYLSAEELGKAVVITKLATLQEDGDIEKQVFTEVRKSLRRLKLERIPFLLVHRMESLYQGKRRLADALLNLKRKRLAANIGASVYTRQDVEYLLKQDIFDAVQLPLNLMDLRLLRSGLLKELEERQTVVFARSVFLQGLFFYPPAALPSHLALARDHLLQLGRLCKENNTTIAEAAIAFVRDLPGITSLVLGCESRAQLAQNLALVETAEIGDALKAQVMETFRDVPEKVLNPVLWKRG